MSGARRLLWASVTLVLALSLVASVGAVGYLAVVAEHTNEPYTELALLGSEGNATNYPERLAVGETGRLEVVVYNNRATVHNTTLVTTYGDGRTVREIRVPARGSWNASLTVTPSEPGREALNVSLYSGPTTGDPNHTTRLWVTAA